MSTTNMKDFVNEIINPTAKKLKALYNKEYWPCVKDSQDVSEADITLYLCKNLITKGWLVYQEVPFYKGTHKKTIKRLDAIALSKDKQKIICIEAKRIWGNVKPKEIIYDIKRIEKYDPPNARDYNLNIHEKIGLIIGDCWRNRIAEWWEKEPHSNHPEGYRSKTWEVLGDLLDKAEVGSIRIYENEGKRKKELDPHDQFLVYALFKV